MAASDLTAARLRELFNYDPETGEFSRKATVATNSRGYVSMSVDGRDYVAHRLAWLYLHGEWPPEFIDHINGNKSDNRAANLRAASRFDNAANVGLKQNNTTGFKGVYRHKQSGRFYARITDRATGRQVSLGAYSSAEEAHAAYCRAAAIRHGEFANVGR